MRVRKTVKIDDREFVLRELTVAEIIDLFENTTSNAKSVGDNDKVADTTDFLKEEIQRMLSLSLEGEQKVEDFYKMAPSELKILYDAFKEANKVFFHIAVEMGLEKMLDEVKTSIQRDFSKLLANSLKAATRKSLPMDTPTS